jgi:hypothetical protein
MQSCVGLKGRGRFRRKATHCLNSSQRLIYFQDQYNVQTNPLDSACFRAEITNDSRSAATELAANMMTSAMSNANIPELCHTGAKPLEVALHGACMHDKMHT